MIYLYGDSHANRSFRGLQLPHIDCHEVSITMFRIGRDNQIINFNADNHDMNSIICFIYGEVDCRYHIQRQIDLGRDEDSVIEELVAKYFKTIRHNVILNKQVIVTAVIPPTAQEEYEQLNGPITHEFPFVGKDADRVRYTRKVNALMKELCITYNYIYFDPYSFYTREDGTLKYNLSDKCVHIGDNAHVLEKFTELYNIIV